MKPYKVWGRVDELAFHENAIFLEACARSQVEDSHSVRNIQQSSHPDLPWARNFLDDFALVAAGPGEASNVTAACLEFGQSGGEVLTIRIAKNEDFNSEARLRLSQITQIMNRVRQRELPIPEARDLCFSLVVTGCKRRILKQITGPKGLINLVSQVPSTTIELNAKHKGAEPEVIENIGEDDDCRQEDSPQLAASRWKEMRQLINRLQVTWDLEATKRLARLAYDVRRSNCLRVLLNAHCRPQYLSLQIIERLGKIARFFRSAVSIVCLAASAAVRSKHIRFKTVPSIRRRIVVLRDHTAEKMKQRIPALAGKPSIQVAEIQRFLRRWQKYIVHAEMLLLTFYEEHPQITVATNYFGISKRSCYLCANFIRIHGTFTVEGQHQQLYSLWTLPEQINFGSQDRQANFARAIQDLQLLVAQRVTEVSVPWYRPMTHLKESVANFSRLTIVPRAWSRETLNKFTQAEERMSSIGSRPQLVKDDVDAKNSSARDHPKIENGDPKKTGPEILHEVAEQDIETEASASVLTVSTVKESSCVADLRATQTPQVVSTRAEKPLTKDAEKELPRAGKRHRRHRHRSEKHRRRTRIKTTRSATPLQSHRRAKRRQDAYRFSNANSLVPARNHTSKRRHSKKGGRVRPDRVTSGCMSIALAWLMSAKRVMLTALHKRY